MRTKKPHKPSQDVVDALARIKANKSLAVDEIPYLTAGANSTIVKHSRSLLNMYTYPPGVYTAKQIRHETRRIRDFSWLMDQLNLHYTAEVNKVRRPILMGKGVLR